MKPTESNSPHRPLKKASEGRVLTLNAVILRAGHTTSTLKIGACEFDIGNANLRHESGIKDL